MSNNRPIINERTLTYLLEGENASERNKALSALAKAKERERKEDLIAVRVDERTIKLVPRTKAENL